MNSDTPCGTSPCARIRSRLATVMFCMEMRTSWQMTSGSSPFALPALSTGAYRYPISEAARIAVETTREFLGQNNSIDKIIFVAANDEIFSEYQRLL